MPTPPHVAVIVPSHRAEAQIGACLDGLLAQTYAEPYEVHVVDTGEDGTEAVVAERAPSWDGGLRYHRAEGRGPGRQRNQGAERSGAALLAFTDSDCVPEPDWLAAGVARLEEGAAIVQGPVRTPDGSAPPPFRHAITIEGPSPLYESCNIFYAGREFREAGGFSVDLFDLTGSHMGEDTELGWRVRRRGGHAVYDERALVRHVVHPPDYAHHLRYQWQASFFPRLVQRVPELRREFLTGGLLLGPQSVRCIGALAALALGRRRRWTAVLAYPYAADLFRTTSRERSPRSVVMGVAKRLIADGVREAGLIWGSVRYRSPVL